MKRRLIIEIETNDTAEHSGTDGFEALLDNLQDTAEEAVKCLIDEDAKENGYAFNGGYPGLETSTVVLVDSMWVEN